MKQVRKSKGNTKKGTIEASDCGLGPVLTPEKLAGLSLAIAPRKFAGCTTLNISNNSIRKITLSLGEVLALSLEDVEIVLSDNNAFHHFEGILLPFPRLRQLSLRNNCLSKIDRFDTQCFLQKLDLSNNRLKTINGLGNSPLLETLRELYISFNQISELEALSLLPSFENLQVLDLRGNLICDDPQQGGLVAEGFCMLSCSQLCCFNGRQISSKIREAVTCWAAEDSRGIAVAARLSRLRSLGTWENEAPSSLPAKASAAPVRLPSAAASAAAAPAASSITA